MAFRRGDLDAAQKGLLEAMEIQKQLTPESLQGSTRSCLFCSNWGESTSFGAT